MFVLIFWAAFGFICMQIAAKKGRGKMLWLFLGAIFGVFALIVITLLPAA